LSGCNCGSTPCSCSIFKGLKGCIDGILGVRDCIGAALHPVYIVTREWSGEQPGDGNSSETEEQILPTPEIKDYGHDLRLTEGGAIRQGDIILRNISKNQYPNESDLDCSTDGKRNIEKYYLINDRYYTVIHIKEDYLVWHVHLRKRNEERNQ
jgi:hypothetical protein